jgi:glutathione S-transferase
MAEELVFYTHPMSRGRVVRWMLEEIGMPYRTEIIDYGPTMKAPAYLAVNPMGKVPALRLGDSIVTETAAICAYLADAFPAAGLAPPPGALLSSPVPTPDRLQTAITLAEECSLLAAVASA